MDSACNSLLVKLPFDLEEVYNNDEVFEYAAELVYNYIERKGIVTVTSFSTENNTWHIKSVQGVPALLVKINKILGYDLKSLTGYLERNLIEQVITKELRDFGNDLTLLSNGVIGKNASKAINQLLNIKTVFNINIQHESTSWGNISIITRHDTREVEPEFITKLAALLSIIIKRNNNLTELKEKEAVFHNFFTNNSVPMLQINPISKTILNANRAAQMFYGYTHNEMIGMHMQQINVLPPEEIDQKMERALSEVNSSHRFTHKLSNGETREVEVFASVIPTQKDPFLSITILDITESEAYKKQLETSELRYRTLFEYSSDPNLIIEGDRFILCNQATMDFLGYQSKSGVEGKHPWELSPEYQPDGQTSKDKAKQMIDICREKGHHRFEWIHQKKNGTLRTIDVALTRLPENDKVYTIWRDITENKKAQEELILSEQKYKQLINNLDEGLMQINHDDQIIFVNPRACNMLGYAEKELLGQSFIKLFIHPEDTKLELLNSFNRRKNISNRYTIRLIKKDKSVLWAQISGSPIKESDQNIIGSNLLITDISSLKEQEKELNRHKEQLEQKVNERTAELEQKNLELVRLNKLFVGREFRIKELRDQVKSLQNELKKI